MGNKINPREGFISDSLVNMGKRLQVNYDLQNSDENEVSSASSEDRGLRADAAESAEVERMRRELRERIGHENAAVGAELESVELCRGELEKFKDSLGEVDTELEQPLIASGAKHRLEEISYRFFVARGRARGFFRGADPGSVISSADFERKPAREIWREQLPLVIAFAVAALMVSASIVIALR